MKKWVSWLCACAMVLSLVSVGSVASVSAATEGDFEYTEDWHGIIITKYNGFEENLVVPSKLDGSEVVGIGDGAFQWNEALTSVIIPDTVTSIGDKAFYHCAGLTEVMLGTELEEIGSYAFASCPLLTEITIPGNVRLMGNYAFANCTGLKNVEWGTNGWSRLEHISAGAFSGCTSLTSITIPNGMESISTKAFQGCETLQTVVIPSGVESIGDQAFADCPKLTTVTYNGLNDSWQKIAIGSGNDDLLNASFDYRVVKYTIDTVEVPGVVQGDTVSIDIRTSAVMDIACVELKVEFVSYAFEFVEGTAEGYLAAMDMISIEEPDTNRGEVWITGMGEAQIGEEDEVIARLTFKAKKAIVTDYEFTVVATPIALASDGCEYRIAWTDGGVKMAALPGDVNADGNVDMLDAYTVFRAASTGSVPLAVETFADMNDDGEIDMRDAYAVYRIASGAV